MTYGYLLDTHTLLWWSDESSRLSAQAITLISDFQNLVFVSSVSAWEISIKKAIGKLDAPDDLEEAIALSEMLKSIRMGASQKCKLPFPSE